MPPQTPSSPVAAVPQAAPPAPDDAMAPTPAVDPAALPEEGAPSKQEDDDSRAGSMTLLLPRQPAAAAVADKEKQLEAGLPLPPLPPLPALQRPRKRASPRHRHRHSGCNASTWVLTLLAAAAIMAAVAAAAMAMAARAEIARLKSDVNRLRNRLGSHEALQNYVDGVLASGMAPAPEEEDESVPWDEPEGSNIDDLSPSYPEINELEFPADVKSSSPRHSRRHIPTIGGSYVSSENGWRPGKSEKRLKLYDELATGTFAPDVAKPAAAAAPAMPAVPAGHYHHRSNSGRLVAPSHVAAFSAPPADKLVVARRSRVMEHISRNDASWKQRNQMHIQHHLQRQNNSATLPTPPPKPALLMEFSGAAAQTAKWQKGEAMKAAGGGGGSGGGVVAGHFNLDANRRSKTVPPAKAEQTASWCSSSWMSQHGQRDHFSIHTNSGLSSIIVRTPGIYYVYAQANPEVHGLVLQRNGRRQTWCKSAPGSTCFTGSVVALDAGDNVTLRAIDGQLLSNTSASLGFVRLAC